MIKMRLLASILAFLFFLCMAHPCAGASGREMVEVFISKKTAVSFKKDDGTITTSKPHAFRVPAFVGGIFNEKEFLVVLCDAPHNDNTEKSFVSPAARISYGDYTTWSDAEIIVNNTQRILVTSVIGGITAVMKGNKIFVLDASCEELSTNGLYQSDNTGWDPLMIVGTVTNREESNGAAGVYVKWEKGTSLKSLLPKKVLGSNGLRFVGGVGSGVVTKSGTIIFPIQIANVIKEYATSIMYSADNGSTWHIGGSTEKDTSDCSVIEWGNGKLLLSARYDREFRKAYESDDMGTTWKESTMLSQVWGNQQYLIGVGSQGSLITVSVDEEDVLLFLQKINTKSGSKRDTLQLWMSDGQRIKCVGTISDDGKGELSGYSILAHVGDHLYIMHESNLFNVGSKVNSAIRGWNKVIVLSVFPDLFKSVRNTVRAWRQVDAELTKIHVPTNGLVGFLAVSENNTIWEDKYNCVHATVNGASQVPGGFRFDGTQGSGAQWPVESQGQNHVYMFTKEQFTIAATVYIHSTAESGEHLLLGASVDAAGTQVFIGLGYTQDNRWSVVDANGIKMTTGVSFEQEKEYHVAITFENGAVSVYVDGVLIIKWRKPNYGSSTMSHFFMGGIGKLSTATGCLCTVKNVMLYNRALNKTEIDGIKNVEKYVHQDIPMISTEQTDTVVDHTSSSKKQHADTSMSFESKSGATLEYPTSLSDTKQKGTSMGYDSNPKDTMKYSESSSTMYNEENTDLLKDETPPEDGKDKPEKQSSEFDTSDTDNSESEEKKNDETALKNPKHHSHGGDTKTNDKHVDGAVWTISFSAWMCLACTAILLACF